MNNILRPWENVDPSPLPDVDAILLAELYEYAEQIADADTRADSTSMEKAAKLEALYLSTAWSDEWSAARPAKPDAVGRPAVPTSRNRFNDWMQWRAEKENRHALNRASIYRLLTAREVASYVANGDITTEGALRPWAWMLKAKYADRIPEVEKIASKMSAGQPVNAIVARKALAQWKLEVLGGREAKKASLGIKARSRRKIFETDFKDLLLHDRNEAYAALLWAAEQLDHETVTDEAKVA